MWFMSSVQKLLVRVATRNEKYCEVQSLVSMKREYRYTFWGIWMKLGKLYCVLSFVFASLHLATFSWAVLSYVSTAFFLFNKVKLHGAVSLTSKSECDSAMCRTCRTEKRTCVDIPIARGGRSRRPNYFDVFLLHPDFAYICWERAVAAAAYQLI